MRGWVLALAMMLAATAGAQVITRKKLLITVGAGWNALSTTSDSALFTTSGHSGGTFDFAFGYAITDRFSLGFHYQRLGHTGFQDPATRLRVTSYQFEAGWRAWQRGNDAVELTAALGTSIPAFLLAGEGLPATTSMSVFTVGGRYLHQFSEVLGIFGGLSLPRSGTGVLSIGDRPLSLANGQRISMQWSAATIEAGVLIRF